MVLQEECTGAKDENLQSTISKPTDLDSSETSVSGSTHTVRVRSARAHTEPDVVVSLLMCTWPDDTPAGRHLASLARQRHSRCMLTQ